MQCLAFREKRVYRKAGLDINDLELLTDAGDVLEKEELHVRRP